MKNLLTRLGEQYVGANICVDVTSNSELRRMFDALLNGKTTMVDYYTTFGRAVKYGTNFLLNDADVEYPCLLSMQDGELSLHAGYDTVSVAAEIFPVIVPCNEVHGIHIMPDSPAVRILTFTDWLDVRP